MMVHPVEYARWATGQTDSVPGAVAVLGPSNNLLLKVNGWTVAVRPIAEEA